jgi:hypothetical protein
MDRLLRRLVPSLDDHLSDDRTASLFCHELRFAERLIARRHLAKCWHCRVRREDLEGRRADRMVELYREAFESEDLTLSAMTRAEFVQRLEGQHRDTSPRGWWAFRVAKIALPELSSMNPMFSLGMVLGVATAISLVLLWQRRIPDITSNTLLVRAERWDGANFSGSPGVVCQTVRITAPKQTLVRSIYRDLRGKRLPKKVALAAQEEQLRTALLQAGVDWDEPISASGYQQWHDHQHVRVDRIVRSGAHLLRLTTSVPEGSVVEQSLTVRDTDFHPVRRTVSFRGRGTVEIAELDFKILPWSSVDKSIFEPLGSEPSAVTARSARVLQFPHLPEVLNEDQLDEAELGARLMLNQLHADTGEQIAIRRVPQGVVVEGVVETDERKRTLLAQLRTVAHLTVAIQSVADLKNDPGTDADVVEIKTGSMPDQPAPLETYLMQRGRSIGFINVLAEDLFNNALAISQESKAIDELEARFSHGEQRTVLAAATLSELMYSHHERLQAALRQERSLLAEIQDTPSSHDGAAAATASSLLEAAVRNLGLCKELTQTNNPATRSAERILAEMSISMGDLTADAREGYGMAQGDSTLSGKK